MTPREIRFEAGAEAIGVLSCLLELFDGSLKGSLSPGLLETAQRVVAKWDRAYDQANSETVGGVGGGASVDRVSSR